MPFLLSSKLELIEDIRVIEFQKKFGIILSKRQTEKQRYQIIQNSLKNKMNFVETFSNFSKEEVVSFVFLISQFGDTILDDTPLEYSHFKKNPFVLEWKENHFTIPYEILEYLAHEKIFKEQNYLFSLIHSIPVKEKKSWMKWLGIIYEGDTEKEINLEIYNHCRLLQKPFEGKSFVTEEEFSIEKLWTFGSNQFLDWYYKGISNFYYSLQELAKVEKDPFFLRIISEIKSGKLVLKKNKVNFGEKDSFKLVSSVEGKTIQFREKILFWEEKNNPNSLFQIS